MHGIDKSNAQAKKGKKTLGDVISVAESSAEICTVTAKEVHRFIKTNVTEETLKKLALLSERTVSRSPTGVPFHHSGQAAEDGWHRALVRVVPPPIERTPPRFRLLHRQGG